MAVNGWVVVTVLCLLVVRISPGFGRAEVVVAVKVVMLHQLWHDTVDRLLRDGGVHHLGQGMCIGRQHEGQHPEALHHGPGKDTRCCQIPRS